MSEFFIWLLNNPAASITFVVAFGILAGVLIVTYLIAFFQGREISFWPPKLGNRPEVTKLKDNNSKSSLDYHQENGDAKKVIELFAILNNHSIEHAKGWSSYNSEIIKNLEDAKEVRILKIKGRDFYKEFPIKNALVDRVAAKKFTRILLQSPSSKFVTQTIASEYKWPDFESYMKDFIHSLEMLSKELPNYKDVVRLYDFLPLLKIYIFDDDVFVSIYSGKVDDRSRKEEVNVWHLSRATNTFGIAQFIENFLIPHGKILNLFR